MREGSFRILSCLTGLFCGLLLPVPGVYHNHLTEIYNYAWDLLALGGCGALTGLLVSRVLYRGAWSSWQPGPPRGFTSTHRVPEMLATAMGCLSAISLMAALMARIPENVPYSLLSAALGAILWAGLQRWEVSTPAGVKVYRTFYGLQWLARDSNPALRWETPTGTVGIRSDEAVFEARNSRAHWRALAVAGVVAAVLVFCVAVGDAGGWAVLLAAFYAPLPFYLLAHRLFYLLQPSGVEHVLGNTPQPRARENPLLPDARPPDRRGCILMLLALPWTWILVALAAGFLSLPSFYVAETAHIRSMYLGLPWLVWTLVKLLEGRRSHLWHEVDLNSLSVIRLEVRRGYQFARTTGEGRLLRAVGVTSAPGAMNKWVPVLYFEEGGYLTFGDGEEQSWAWEIACRLAQKAVIPAISPRSSVLTAEVSGWIRSGDTLRFSEWGPVKQAPPPVGDEPPVD